MGEIVQYLQSKRLANLDTIHRLHVRWISVSMQRKATTGVSKMQLKRLGANRAEIMLPNGAVIFFSYDTPVAAQLAHGGFVRTDRTYSRTTTKHITQWLNGANAVTIPQSELDAMIGA